MSERPDIKSMLLTELETYFESIGERSFRAKQTFQWLHRGAPSFGVMTDLPEALRDRLAEEFCISVPVLSEKHVSKHDGTIKYLWSMDDGAAVECVIMEYEHGNTICISSQVGCRMGCAFCASAMGGLKRNLTAPEMVNQVLFSQIDSEKKLSNVVLMGIGEPLDNFDNLIRFLELLGHEFGLNIGARHITVSTCGIIENIDKLAEYRIKCTLTVSLHSADDETRSRLMPINRDVGVDKLLETCSRYFHKTGRRVSYEYAMIDGVNDTSRHAELLAVKLKNTESHLNLIPLSNVPERPFRGSSQERVNEFSKILRQKGVNCTIRRSLGGDIAASCGQLRGRSLAGDAQGIVYDPVVCED